MVRSLCSQNKGLKKGPWTPEEDQKLIAYIKKYGHGNWRSLPAKAGLQRCGKSCRLRWINYLKPDIKRGNFSLQEDRTILQLHALLGNKWSLIAAHLPKRTDNEIKNYWNTRLKKRLMKMGIDPITHKPKTNALGHLLHMAQWESARLEAETRHNQNLNPPRLTITKVPPPRTSLTPCLDILKAWQQQTSHSVLSPPSEHTNTNKLLHSNSMYALMLVNESSQNETNNKLPNPTIIISNSFGLGANHNIKYYSETGNNNDGYSLNPKENPIDDAAAVPEIDQKDNSNIPVLPLIPNNIIDNVEGGGGDGDGDGGLDDMSAAFDDYHDKLFSDEIGDGGGKDFDYWNTLLDLDDHFSPASPSLSEYSC